MGLNETGNHNMNWSNFTLVFAKYNHTCIYHRHRNLLVEGVTPLVSQVSLSRDAGLWCVARWWLSAHRPSGPFVLESLRDGRPATTWSTHWDDSQYPLRPGGPGGPGTPGIPGTPGGPLRPSRPLLPYAGVPGSPESRWTKRWRNRPAVRGIFTDLPRSFNTQWWIKLCTLDQMLNLLLPGSPGGPGIPLDPSIVGPLSPLSPWSPKSRRTQRL